MSVTVTIQDTRPPERMDGEDSLFTPTRYRDVRHPKGNRFVITAEGALIVINVPPRTSPEAPLSEFTVAAYPAGHWIGAVRR